MRTSRVFVLVALFALAAGGAWWYWSHRGAAEPSAIAVYFVKTDGSALVSWNVSLGPARDPRSVAFYAAVQCVAGPPAGTDAIRFPAGTRVLGVELEGSTVDVDLSREVGFHVEGSLGESAEFRALVYTMTGLAGTTAVKIRVGGLRVATLPGGHLELDEPLTRASF